MELRFTLLTDGSSDRVLIPVLTWLLQQAAPATEISPQWADFRFLPQPPTTLYERIVRALDFYPCDLLFVHRDTENAERGVRQSEITAALSQLYTEANMDVPCVFVIPVRMQEAWLLIEEQAIRRAAGNPRGRVRLEMPRRDRLEAVPDPKATLYALLRTASEQTGRRLHRLSLPALRFRIAELIQDFTPLRVLPAFAALEHDLTYVVRQNHWDR
ncbi:MAG: hypothetical protein ACE14L_08610 [Terriglobales bacterium]